MTTITGVIDVGSHRGMVPEIGAGGDPSICFDGAPPELAGSSYGGGAGGSFTGIGGTGGASGEFGAGGKAGSVVATITELRGGCAGQDGNGARGHGGGAVFLIAGNSINVGGAINAAGEGGSSGFNSGHGGGAGGGAGGMIGFDAPVVASTGLILANGGGGGQGSCLVLSGLAGSDPIGISAAPGGSQGGGTGGPGGPGSAGAPSGAGGPGEIAGNVGSCGAGGGGGGGGGAGLVQAPATASLGTQVSPAPTTP